MESDSAGIKEPSCQEDGVIFQVPGQNQDTLLLFVQLVDHGR